ncbi:efflux RND transporter permease subunit [candidate division KSB1 bacterium]|nr:efflux RND transporter permease subunit [candidate division KSB1 bacterium]
MKLSVISIQRPVFASVMSLVILLFGMIAFSRLPVREYPDIDPPIVSVSTFYRGASPSVVETEITNVLEEQFATLEGVKTMTSSSQEQGSIITIEFELGRDINEATNEVRDRVSRIRGTLPREVDDPIISKVDANAQPILWIALYSSYHSGLELSDVADRILKERIQRLPGVGSVMIGGERRYAMRVWLDPLKMAAHGLTAQDIENAIRTENAEIPGGRVEGKEREFAVRTRGELTTPDEFGAIIVSQNESDLVRLRDVAEVQVGAEDERSLARYNGETAVGLGVIKQSKANTVDVADDVLATLPELSELLPEGMQLDVAFNSSTFIKESINQVAETIIIAMILVVLVVLSFLKSFRATTIPTLAIPISIMGAFAVAYFSGFTINILTLLALVLAIGLVVDDAIVMLENIYRHIEMGKNRWQAAIDGSKEIGFAIVATTLALIAVFVPLAFLTGNVGRLFNEFGVSLAAAVAISGFVALTLSPMLASKILRPLHGASQSWASRSFDRFFDFLNRIYENMLRFVLHFRFASIIGAVVMVLVSVWLFYRLPSELVPTEDRGVGFGIVIAPEGSTLEYTDRYMREIENRLLALPERHALFSALGLGFQGPGRVTNGFMFLSLKPRDQREKSQQQIVQELFPQLFSIPGVLAFVINPPSLGGRFNSNPVDYVLQSDNYEELNQAVGAIMSEASKLGYLINLDSDLRLNKPQLDIHIDRERAAGLGVSVTEIGSTLETLLGGRRVTNFKRAAKQYDVILQMQSSERATPEAIQDIYIRGKGGLIQLANVVKLQETVAPKELNHYNRLRSARISASLVPGISLGKALDDIDGIAQQKLPTGMKREFAGQSLEYKSSSSSLYFMFLFAVVFIYLVLAAQFESYIHPITILLSVPLAVFGALLTLFLFGESLNIYSQIGLIMLVGLVTKNAILIVEFSNQLRERGNSVLEAVVQAAIIRLRPILMTSFATIFGVLPIAIGLGAGGEARQPLGLAVVGGMLFSTFLTLLLVPVVYTLLARFTKAKKIDDLLPEGQPKKQLVGETSLATES